MFTKEEVIYNLRTNPRELLKTIIYNNPNAVNNKLGAVAEVQGDTPERINDYVMQLLDEGHNEEVENIVTVPFNYESATQVLIDAHDQMVMDRGATKQGRFVDSSGGLYLLANSKVKGTRQVHPNKPCGCAGVNLKPQYFGVKTKYIIGAIVLAVAIYVGSKLKFK